MAHLSKESATDMLVQSFGASRSRRSLLKAAAATGLAATAAGMAMASPAHAGLITGTRQPEPTPAPVAADTATTILTVARTAEQLAVTFYGNGVRNAAALGLGGQQLDWIKAALIEEQIHLNFFAANGGGSLASTFSFPQGAKTFTDLQTFIATQQQLEGVFDSAFLAAVLEFAQMGQARLAQISAQVAMIESEHRALGRAIVNLDPADNWAFAPVLVASVGQAPALVASAGYLSPVSGNSYSYQPTDFTDPSLAPIVANILYQTP